MRTWLAALSVLALTSSCFAFSVDEIAQLKKLGFTNDQIVALQTPRTPAPHSAPTQREVPTHPDQPKVTQRLATLSAQTKGLAVLCLTKEGISRGPGYLEVSVRKGTSAWKPLTRLQVLEYSADGSKAATIFQHLPGSRFLPPKTIIQQQDVIISHYRADYELPAGTYEIKIERDLVVGTNGFGIRFTEQRHKLFHNVDIRSGRATILSYYWGENRSFGLDHVMTPAHKAFVSETAAPYAPCLAELKVQHNN